MCINIYIYTYVVYAYALYEVMQDLCQQQYGSSEPLHWPPKRHGESATSSCFGLAPTEVPSVGGTLRFGEKGSEVELGSQGMS